VGLPVLFFMAHYYLTDMTEIKYGGIEAVPGSRLFGAPCPRVMEGTPWENQVRSRHEFINICAL